MEENRKVPFHIMLPVPLKQTLREAAHKEGRSMASLIREAIDRYLMAQHIALWKRLRY